MKTIWQQPILLTVWLGFYVGHVIALVQSPARLSGFTKEASSAQFRLRLTVRPTEAPSTADPHEDHHDIGQRARDQIEGDLHKTHKKVKEIEKLDTREILHRNVAKWRGLYLSKLNVIPYRFEIATAFFLASMAWFFVYFKYIFTSDRHRYREQFLGPAHRNKVGDLVFVFDHPEGPKADQDQNTQIDPRKFGGSVFLGDDFNDFPRVRALMSSCDEVDGGKSESEGEPSFRSKAESEGEEGQRSQRSKADSVMDTVKSTLTLGMVRSRKYSVSLYDVKVAMLQDAVEIFLHMGCKAQVFSSIDKDELYLCVCMNDEAQIMHQIARNDSQIRLNPDLIPKLNIGYCPVESNNDDCRYMYAPPYVRFDPKELVSRLHKAHVIDQPDPTLVYQHSNHNHHSSFVGCSQRSRIIYKLISRTWDSTCAVDQGLMLAWFPLHTEGRVALLREKWGTSRLLTDLSFFQPLEAVFDYFGARVAFISAWNGMYCKTLLALAPVAIVVSLLSYTFSMQGHIETAERNPMGAGFALVLVVWSKIAINLWSREQQFLSRDWNMREEGGIELPAYRGDLRPSRVDLNVKEKWYPRHKEIMWRTLSHSITILFCGLVCITTYMWDFLFDGKVSLTASIVLALQIKIFELIYHALAIYLTQCENYRYQRDWTDSFLWKKFIFYSVNSYYPFFYLMVIQGAAQGRCPEGGCLMVLQKKLMMTMSVLVMLTIVQAVVASVVLDLKVWWEARQLKRSGMYKPGEEPVASYEERQAKAGDYGTDCQVDTMIQLVLPLGFVMLFGPTTPLTVVLCLILFAVNIRATGRLLLTAVRRPFPHRALGIGAWKEVLDMLMKAGVVANGFFIVQYGEAFQGSPLLTKCSGIFLFACVCAVLCSMVDSIVPEEAREVQLLIKRQGHVLDRLSHTVANRKSAAEDRDKQSAALSMFSVASLPTGSDDPVPPDMQNILDAVWSEADLFPSATKGSLHHGDNVSARTDSNNRSLLCHMEPPHLESSSSA